MKISCVQDTKTNIYDIRHNRFIFTHNFASLVKKDDKKMISHNITFQKGFPEFA